MGSACKIAAELLAQPARRWRVSSFEGHRLVGAYTGLVRLEELALRDTATTEREQVRVVGPQWPLETLKSACDRTPMSTQPTGGYASRDTLG